MNLDLVERIQHKTVPYEEDNKSCSQKEEESVTVTHVIHEFLFIPFLCTAQTFETWEVEALLDLIF